jgi:hypothetical protein
MPVSVPVMKYRRFTCIIKAEKKQNIKRVALSKAIDGTAAILLFCAARLTNILP